MGKLGDFLKNAKKNIEPLVEQANKQRRARQQAELRRQQELQWQREEQQRREEERQQQEHSSPKTYEERSPSSKLSEEEEIKAYGATLDDYISAWSDPPSDILSDIYQSRIDAARQLKADSSSSDHKYTVTSDAEELLHDLKLDLNAFQAFHGNVLQHTLHSEFVSMIDDLAPAHHAYGHIDSIADLNHLAVKANDIGRQYNASGDINNASYIADACWYIVYGLKEATIGAGEGVIQGVGNTGHMIYHYDETIRNIGYGIAWLVNGVITNTKDGYTLMCGDDEEAAEAWDSLCGRVRHVKDVLEYLRDNASIRDVTREVTSFAVEGYVCHQMISTLVDFYKKADRYAAIIKKYIPPYQKNVLLETAEGMYVEIADDAAIEVAESVHTYLQETDKASTTKPQLTTSRKRIGQPSKATGINHPVLDNIRTGKALKLDSHHAFSNIVDNYAKYAEKFIITGDDGLTRELYQIEGAFNGTEGIFEWIVDPREDRGVTHRVFIKNGKITGKPNVFK